MRVRQHPEAANDLREAALYYAGESGATLAQEFIDEYVRAEAKVTEQPEIGTPGPRGSRRVYLRRFPYAIVYLVDVDLIRVVAVAHAARREDYWHSRA